MWICNVSRMIHKFLTGRNESFCSFAYHNQHRPFWALWVRVFGREHCRKSHSRYH